MDRMKSGQEFNKKVGLEEETTMSDSDMLPPQYQILLKKKVFTILVKNGKTDFI